VNREEARRCELCGREVNGELGVFEVETEQVAAEGIREVG
jgi:ribosome-binding protein aMBF1 (putative translation factor)